jgi:hypothetical protein
MKIIDKISWEMKKVYKDITGRDEFVHYLIMPYSYVEITGICEHKDCKEIKEMNFPHIIPYISTNNNMSGNSKWPKKGDFFKQFDRTGLFKIELVDGSVLLFGRWLEGSGRSREVQSVVVAEKENLYKFFKLIRVASKKKARPKNGIYTINYHEMFGLIYEKLEKLPDSPVIHPVVDDVLKEIDFYFNNLEIFRRFKQTGNRKIMLLSEKAISIPTSTLFEIKLFLIVFWLPANIKMLFLLFPIVLKLTILLDDQTLTPVSSL